MFFLKGSAFPKCAVSILSLVVLLTSSTSNQLNGIWNDISSATVKDEKMDMI